MTTAAATPQPLTPEALLRAKPKEIVMMIRLVLFAWVLFLLTGCGSDPVAGPTSTVTVECATPTETRVGVDCGDRGTTTELPGPEVARRSR